MQCNGKTLRTHIIFDKSRYFCVSLHCFQLAFFFNDSPASAENDCLENRKTCLLITILSSSLRRDQRFVFHSLIHSIEYCRQVAQNYTMQSKRANATSHNHQTSQTTLFLFRYSCLSIFIWFFFLHFIPFVSLSRSRS